MHQAPEQAPAARELQPVQVGQLPFGQVGGDELLQALAGFIQYPQRPVAGADQFHGSGDKAVQHRVQVQLPTEGQHRIQQVLQPVLGLRRCLKLFGDLVQLGIQLPFGKAQLPRFFLTVCHGRVHCSSAALRRCESVPVLISAHLKMKR